MRTQTTSSHSNIGATPSFTTTSEVFKRYSSPPLVSLSKNPETPRLESPVKSSNVVRYQPRFESPSERDGLKSPPSSPLSQDKSTSSKENFVLLDQDDFSKGIEVIRSKIDSIEDEMKSMQSQYSRFQEKVYRTGLKQNIFDFKDKQLRYAVDNATKIFQEKLNLIQSLDNTEKEIQNFLNDIYKSFDSHILDVISFGDEKLRLRIECFEKIYTKNLRIFSTHFGKETSSKVNKTQKMLEEGTKIIELINSFVKSLEKCHQHDLEVFYSQVPTEMVRLLKLTHNCLSSFACSVEKKKELESALLAKDVNQVRLLTNSFSNELEKIVASEFLKEAKIFLSHHDSDQSLLDEKERRKKEVVQRIKNIIEKSETFSVEKQQKFTQILLESGIRDPVVLRELRMTWETKRNRVFDEKFNKEHLLQTYMEKLKAAILSKDVKELECAVIVPDGIKSEVEKWNGLRQEAKYLLDSLLSVSVEELDFKLKLEKMLSTRDLSDLKIMETQNQKLKNPEINEIWKSICELQKKQEIALQSIDISLGSYEFGCLLSSISLHFCSNFVEKQWKLWENVKVEMMHKQFEEALSEKDESKLKNCLEVIEKEERITTFFSSSVEHAHNLLNSIQDCRVLLENAIEKRERSCLENALYKGIRYSNSLSGCLERANTLLLELEREEMLMAQYAHALKTRDLEQLGKLVATIESNSELKMDNLLWRAKAAESEIRLFINLESFILEKDVSSICQLLPSCKDCKEFCLKVLIDEAENFITQNQNAKNKIIAEFENIHEISMFEDCLKKLECFLSSQDMKELRNQWREFKYTQLICTFDSVLRSGNESLLQILYQRVKDLIDSGCSQSNLIELKERTQFLIIKINSLKELMKDTVSIENIDELEEAINGLEGPFLEKEVTILKSKVENFRKREIVLSEYEKLLENGGTNLSISSIDKMLNLLSEQEQNMETFGAIDTLIRKKQSISKEQILFEQLRTELEEKNSSNNLIDLIERSKNIPGLGCLRSSAELFLLKQKEYREELRKQINQQVEAKMFDELTFQKYYEYLPMCEVDQHVNHLKSTLIKLGELQEKYNGIVKSNEQFISREIEQQESIMKEKEEEQKKFLEDKILQLENEFKNSIEIEKERVEAEIEKVRERHKSDLNKLMADEIELKKNIQEEFLNSQESLLINAEKEELLLKQKIEENEQLLSHSTKKNMELSNLVEKIKEKLTQKEDQNKEMILHIKSLEEMFKNSEALEHKLASDESELNNSISQSAERIELQKERLCLLREKIEEKELLLQDRIIYGNVVEEKLKKKEEEIEKQVEHLDFKTKSLISLEQQKKVMENNILIVVSDSAKEEESFNQLFSEYEHRSQFLEEIKLKTKEKQLDLERLHLTIKEEEAKKMSLERLQEEQAEKLNRTVLEKEELEDKLKKSIEMEESKLEDLNEKIQNLVLSLDKKKIVISKCATDIAELETTYNEKEEEHSKLIDHIEQKLSLVKEIESRLCDEKSNLEMMILKEEEFSTKLKQMIKQKEIKEEEERKFKDQLSALEEDIGQLEKNNSNKENIVEKLKDNSKLKTLEKLEMLKKLEAEDDRYLQESIMKEEKSLTLLKESIAKNKTIEEKLENEKQLLETQQKKGLETINGLENDIVQLELVIKELEINTAEKQTYLLELNTTTLTIQEKIESSLTEIEKEIEEISKLELKLSENTTQLNVWRGQRSSIQAQYDLLKENFEKETNEFQMVMENNRDLEINITQLRSNICKLNSEQENLKKELHELSCSQQNIHKEIILLRENLDDQKAQYFKILEEKAGLEKSLEEQYILKAQITESNEKFACEIISLQSTIDLLQKDKEEKARKLKSLEIEIKDLENSLYIVTQRELVETQNNHEFMIKEKENNIVFLELNNKVIDLENNEKGLKDKIDTTKVTDFEQIEPKDIILSELQVDKEERTENDEKKDEECHNDEFKEKKKAILPSKSNKTLTPLAIEMIDATLSLLYKKISKGEFVMDEENKVVLNYDDPHSIEIAKQYAIILSDQCNVGNSTPTFLYNILIPKFVDYIITFIKKETDTGIQNKLKKLLKKLRGFKKSFSELEFTKNMDKEYFSLSILYIYYLYANGVFSKDFWEILFASNDFLKEFFYPTSILYHSSTKEDLIFLTKKQSKFKVKNMNLFECNKDAQKAISENLMIDFPNAPPIESLKSVLAEIKLKINLPEEMKIIVKKKLSRALLSILEVGFRSFKFFGRYYFWDYVKLYVEKVEKTQGEIKDAYLNINNLVSSSNIKITEPNDTKFVLFVVCAFNKRKLAEWFKKLSSLQQIGDYFTEESIIRSDKMNEIIIILGEVEMNAKSFLLELECSEDMLFDYEKCNWCQ